MCSPKIKRTNLYSRPKVTNPQRLYGVQIMTIRAIENRAPLTSLSRSLSQSLSEQNNALSLIVPHSSKGLYHEIIVFRFFSQISFPRARTIYMPIRPCRFFSSARLYRFSSRYIFAVQSHRCDTVWPHLPAKLSLQYLSYAS